MYYCGLDLASVSSYLYVTDGQGRKAAGGEVQTSRQALRQRLGRFVEKGLAVAIEAGNQTAWIHEALVELGARVVVVNPAKVKLIAQSRRKTDKIDAKVLCEPE
ncbi:MAG TPA: transposase [Phycisphaerae bacterium]|nr:transposase [Phycisphaerae bacterium]